MRASAVIVHFHAADLAARAVATLRDDAEQEGLALEVIVVDNGSTPDERETLDALPVRVIDPEDGERSYAAGLNRGVAASNGDLVVLANADIELEPGCLGALRDALEAGFAVVGPRLYLDPARAWLQPPADRRTFAAELAAVLARGGIAPAAVRRSWRRRAHRFWSAEEPLPMRQLSGAMLALTRPTWEEVGSLDEAYRLYFEETDWLMRLARRGKQAALAPAARAVHLWGQSTRLEPRAAAWFEDSARRFRRRWYGPLGARFLEAVSRALPSAAAVPAATGDRAPDDAVTRWFELAASAAGFPAAGHAVDASGGLHLPDLPAHLDTRGYHLRGVDAGGNDRWIRGVGAQDVAS